MKFNIQPKILHPKRDLVICSVDEDQTKIIEEKTKDKGSYLTPNTKQLGEGEVCSYVKIRNSILFNLKKKVTFVGYTVENSGLENEHHSAVVVNGSINLVSSDRYFAKTDITLAMGICGGPVLNSEGQCIGILEGIVNPPSPQQSPEMQKFSEKYAHSALFIPIHEALNLIEIVG